jgi:hypothetical protein
MPETETEGDRGPVDRGPVPLAHNPCNWCTEVTGEPAPCHLKPALDKYLPNIKITCPRKRTGYLYLIFSCKLH